MSLSAALDSAGRKPHRVWAKEKITGGAIPPTGKKATVTGSTMVEIKNDKAVRGWTFWDMAGLLIQLGLMPSM